MRGSAKLRRVEIYGVVEKTPVSRRTRVTRGGKGVVDMKKQIPTIELAEKELASPNLQQKLVEAFGEMDSEEIREAATDKLVIEKLRMMRPTIEQVVVKTAPGKYDDHGYRILYVNGSEK